MGLRDSANHSLLFLTAYSPKNNSYTHTFSYYIKRKSVPALLKDKFIMWNRQIIEGGCNEHVWVHCCRSSHVHKWKLSVVSLMAYCFLMGPLSLLMRFRCHALHAVYGSAQGNILSPSCDQIHYLELRTMSKHKAEMLKNGTVTYYPSAVHVVWFWQPVIEWFDCTDLGMNSPLPLGRCWSYDELESRPLTWRWPP